MYYMYNKCVCICVCIYRCVYIGVCVYIRGGRKKSMHRDSLSNDSGSILSLVFNQMCDDAEFALETPIYCLLPIPYTHAPLKPSVK